MLKGHKRLGTILWQNLTAGTGVMIVNPPGKPDPCSAFPRGVLLIMWFSYGLRNMLTDSSPSVASQKEQHNVGIKTPLYTPCPLNIETELSMLVLTRISYSKLGMVVHTHNSSDSAG